MNTRATAFAPATVGNVAVGFDLLGFSVDFAGDKVSVERSDKKTVTVESSNKTIPVEPAKNTATAGLLRMMSDLHLTFGFRVSIEKGIPLGSGMGGSAASAVAAVVAANALLDEPLSDLELLSYALIGEAQASGGYHADNITPSLLGGLTLARVVNDWQVEVTSIPLPRGIFCVLVHPHLSIETKQARGILKKDLSLKDHIAQSANLAGFIAGCFTNDLGLLRRSFSDVIIEPQRSHLIPGFAEVKRAALAGGALGCSISGAGPSVFAWVEGEKKACEIQTAMTAAFRAKGVEADGWSSPLTKNKARVIS